MVFCVWRTVTKGVSIHGACVAAYGTPPDQHEDAAKLCSASEIQERCQNKDLVR